MGNQTAGHVIQENQDLGYLDKIPRAIRRRGRIALFRLVAFGCAQAPVLGAEPDRYKSATGPGNKAMAMQGSNIYQTKIQ